MGNQTSATGKNSSTASSTGTPNWATPGTTDYSHLNTALQTAPMGAAVNTLANGGMGQTGQKSANTLSQIGQNGGSNPWMNSAASSLGQTAAGNYLNANPYLNDVINQSNQILSDNLNNQFASGGRYGSGYNKEILGRDIAQNTSNLLNSNYQQERQNQLSAANELGGLGEGSLTQQQNALTGAADLENQGFNNQLGMIQQLPTIQANKTYDATQQQNVGSQLNNYSQQELQNLINQFNNADMSDWARIGGLLSAGTTAAGNWGTQSGTQTQPMGASILGPLLGLL